MVRCLCHCHWTEGVVAPPDVRDPVAAAMACPHCLPLHCPALLDGARVVELEAAPRDPTPVASADGYSYDPTNDTD